MKSLPQNLHIEAQLKMHQPEQDFPHYGRDALDHSHAIYSIIEYLNLLGLKDWVPQLTSWLKHYDGLEVYAEYQEDPHLCVRQILANHCKYSHKLLEQGENLKEMIVEEILGLNFVHYRAHWGNDLIANASSRIWHPLKTTWFDFLKQGNPESPTEALHIWLTDEHPKPSLDELRAHLLK